MVGRTLPSFKYLDTSEDRRRCTELIMPKSSCRPRDLIQTHRNVAWINGYVSTIVSLNRSDKDLNRWKTDSGISTAERAKMSSHCKHRCRPSSSLDAILSSMPHGLMAVTSKPSANDADRSRALLRVCVKLLSRLRSRGKDGMGYSILSK